MVKKVMSMVTVLVVSLFIGAGLMNQVEAGPYNDETGEYEKYLNGDPNYILVYGHMKSAYYLDQSSVVVKRNFYEKGNIDRIYAENMVYVDEDGNVRNSITYWYRDYNGDMSYNNGNGWRSFDPFNSVGYMQVVVRGCKLGWQIAFDSVFS